jgi:hypothetical protein
MGHIQDPVVLFDDFVSRSEERCAQVQESAFAAF